MRRVWAALAILAMVLFLCWSGIVTTLSVTNAMLEQTGHISDLIRQGEHAQAYQQALAMEQDWEQHDFSFYLYLPHNEIGEVDAALSELQVCLEQESAMDALVSCNALREALEQLQWLELPLPENIL